MSMGWDIPETDRDSRGQRVQKGNYVHVLDRKSDREERAYFLGLYRVEKLLGRGVIRIKPMHGGKEFDIEASQVAVASQDHFVEQARHASASLADIEGKISDVKRGRRVDIERLDNLNQAKRKVSGILGIASELMSRGESAHSRGRTPAADGPAGSPRRAVGRARETYVDAFGHWIQVGNYVHEMNTKVANEERAYFLGLYQVQELLGDGWIRIGSMHKKKTKDVVARAVAVASETDIQKQIYLARHSAQLEKDKSLQFDPTSDEGRDGLAQIITRIREHNSIEAAAEEAMRALGVSSWSRGPGFVRDASPRGQRQERARGGGPGGRSGSQLLEGFDPNMTYSAGSFYGDKGRELREFKTYGERGSRVYSELIEGLYNEWRREQGRPAERRPSPARFDPYDERGLSSEFDRMRVNEGGGQRRREWR